MKRQRLIVILGPTAVGKTELSIQLAHRLQTDIISGDSMLVYRGFDIGTAKPDAKEQDGIRHYLLDILDADEHFSVVDFCIQAAKYIQAVNEAGHIPLLVGGTGLYIKSLLEGYQFNETPAHEAFRKRLEVLAVQHGREYVHAMLARTDPAAAKRLHVNNFRRVVRALEVCHFGQESISQDKANGGNELAYDAYVIGICRERAVLYERINQRVELMFQAGLVEEVRQLLANGISRSSQAMQGIGYKETAAFLCGEISCGESMEQIRTSTRHFAKRQLTWYRKMPYVHWYDAGTLPQNHLLETVYADLAGYFSRKVESI